MTVYCVSVRANCKIVKTVIMAMKQKILDLDMKFEIINLGEVNSLSKSKIISTDLILFMML
jgi:hypothetical protein